MKTKLVPIDSVFPDPANVRQHPDRNLAAIQASLARFGQQKPLVVDSKGIIRAGNGTHAAAVALGWDKIGVVVSDLAGTDAVAYAIADNRTSELATWDDVALAETLRALQSEDYPLDAVGFDAAEVDRLLERIGGEVVEDAEGEWEGMPEYENEDLTSQFRAIVHFVNEADLRAFEKLVGQKIPTNTKSIWYPKAERQVVKASGYVSDES